jgi:hypothetical protein
MSADLPLTKSSMRSASRPVPWPSFHLIGISSRFKPLKSNLDHKRSEVLPLKLDGLLADIIGNEAKSGTLILKGSGDASGSPHRSIGIEMVLGQYADGKMVHFLQIPTLVAGFLQQSLGAM